MSKGLLEVVGTIDPAQFWPGGTSDGDTAKVVVTAESFRFRPTPGSRARRTRAFAGATVKKDPRSRAGKLAISEKNQVTIRWQGIDAPELHYRPTIEKLSPEQKAALKAVNGNFRQLFGQTATVALGKFLGKLGKRPIPVVVRTAVDEPGDVFDVYGRLIGDIYVRKDRKQRKELNLNHWMLENGWAFPALYASMSREEIAEVLRLAEKARRRKKGIWKMVSSDLTRFDATLRFSDGAKANGRNDSGPVIVPKLFRRLSTFSVEKKARLLGGTFPAFLGARPDGCFETADFLKQGAAAARHRTLDEFVSKRGRFTVNAGDLVFQERGSVVVGKDGRGVRW